MVRYYSPTGRSEIMTHTTTETSLENSVPCENGQAPDVTFCLILVYQKYPEIANLSDRTVARSLGKIDREEIAKWVCSFLLT